MNNLDDKVTEVFGIKTNYIDYVPTDEFKTILLIAPGLMDSTFFKEFIPGFPNYYRFIAPDLPGRGKTEPSEKFNTIDSLANFCIEFMNKVIGEEKPFCIFAISYGTAVANEISRKQTKRIEAVVLGGAGEYLDEPLKTIGKILLLPALINDKLTKLYIDVLAKLYKVLNDFPRHNAKSLAFQYLSALKYKIDDRFISSSEAVIINFNLDYIITKNSIIKLKKFYPNHHVIFGEVPHVMSPENTSIVMKDVLPKVIDALKWKMP